MTVRTEIHSHKSQNQLNFVNIFFFLLTFYNNNTSHEMTINVEQNVNSNKFVEYNN